MFDFGVIFLLRSKVMNFPFEIRRKLSNAGYNPHYSAFSSALISFFNFSLALFFIIIGSPIFIILSLIIYFKYGRPIFYVGKRLGYKKRIFDMYKFRTLPLGTDKKLGAELVSRKKIPLPFWAKFMRETRLDELPQLFNILKRDMDFLGPRPVRPEVYELVAKKIPGYDKRFEVRPGLIGLSQIFTPHSTSKRIRSLIDNRLVVYKYSFILHLYMILLAIYTCIYKFLVYTKKFILENYSYKRYGHKRQLERVRFYSSTKVELYDENDNLVTTGRVVDANDLYIRVFLENFPEDNKNKGCLMKLYIPTKKGKTKIAKIWGKLWREYEDKKEYIFEYEPISEYHLYMVDQYLLNKSLYQWSTGSIS